MATILLLIDDLFFEAKIDPVLAWHALTGEYVRSLGALDAALEAYRPAVVVIDLEIKGADPLAAIARLGDIPVIAFGSHVRSDLLEAARAAGAAEVMPRSRFARDLGQLLAPYAAL